MHYTLKYVKHYNKDRHGYCHGIIKLHNTFSEVLQLLYVYY